MEIASWLPGCMDFGVVVWCFFVLGYGERKKTSNEPGRTLGFKINKHY